MCTILETNFISLCPLYLPVLCVAMLHVCSLDGQEMLVFRVNSLTLDFGYIHQNWGIENHVFPERKMLYRAFKMCRLYLAFCCGFLKPFVEGYLVWS
jgi:hypothetical protein